MSGPKSCCRVGANQPHKTHCRFYLAPSRTSAKRQFRHDFEEHGSLRPMSPLCPVCKPLMAQRAAANRSAIYDPPWAPSSHPALLERDWRGDADRDRR